VKNKSIGAFGQAYYQITDALRLSAGLRWTWDKRQVVLHNLTNVAAKTCSPELTVQADFDAPCSFRRDAKFNYPAWTIGLDYQATDEIFVYGVARRASKAGGFNIRNGSANTPPFSPEKVQDVEFGMKMTTPDRRARANIALFYSWQSGVQRNANALVNIAGNLTTTQYLQNAGKQEVYGAEFEVAVVPWEGMTLAGNLSLLNGFYVPGTFTEVRDIPGANLPGCTPVPNNAAQSRCIVDRSGEDIPQLPKTQFNISATQKVPLDFGELTLFANYSYIASQVSDTNTADPRQPAAVRQTLAEQDQLSRISGYGLLDGRVSLQLENPNLEIFAFGRNLAGKKYVTRRFVALYSSLGTAIEYIGTPRVYGVGATFRFGNN
jgi:iron complex outermembrane receptor protein